MYFCTFTHVDFEHQTCKGIVTPHFYSNYSIRADSANALYGQFNSQVTTCFRKESKYSLGLSASGQGRHHSEELWTAVCYKRKDLMQIDDITHCFTAYSFLCGE